MAFEFSELQRKAIYDSGKSILVNAGAGSGKTAVLAERLRQKILSGVKLKNLIVVTFTKLAASEMKERLRGLLISSINEYPHLIDELNYIDQANIQTFDSFCNEIVKKYHYKLNIKKDFNIVSGKFFLGVLSNILDDIFNEYYNSNNETFNSLITTFTVKDDKSLKELIIKMYNNASSNMMVFNDVSIDVIINKYLDYIKDEKKTLLVPYNKLSKLKSSFTDNITNYIDDLINKIWAESNYSDLKYILDNIKYPRMTSKEFDEKVEFSSCFKEFKDKVDSFKSLFSFSDLNEIENKYQEVYCYKGLIEDIIIKMSERLNEYKIKTNSFDFNDISLLAIKVFEENEDIRLKYKNSINEILIDEYQDTSPIQEKLMNLISNNNMYMVGDVKQSIYRFRNADPKIFTNTYNNLSSGMGEVIDLNSNYRSSNNVIETVNEIFKDLMNFEVGGVNYDLSQHLGFGFKKYLSSPNSDKLKTTILEYVTKADSKYKTFEVEAFSIAYDIKSKVGKIKVFDKGSGQFRYADYKDFAILTYSKDKFDNYKQIFDYLNIPLNLYKDESISSSQMFLVLSNLLKVVYLFDKANDITNNNKHIFRYSLISVLRSYIFTFSDISINTIFTSNNPLAELEKIDSDIYDKIKRLNSIKNYTNICDYFDMIIDSFDVYENLSSLDNVLKEEAIINNFRKVLIDIDNLGYTISEAIDYIDNMIKSNSFDAKIIDESQTNCVKMLTIHASKGLEYPICYFPDLTKSFNFNEFHDKFIYSKEFGVIAPFIDGDNTMNNICKLIEKKAYVKEEVSEKIRLFYVALTRAREQIVILTPQMVKLDSSNLSRSKYDSFYKLLCSLDIDLQKYIRVFNAEATNITLDYKKKVNINLEIDDLSSDKINIINDTFKLYNNTTSLNTITKIHPSKSVILIPSIDELTQMEVGTNFHKSLEFISIKDNNSHNLKYVNDFLNSTLIESLRNEGIINDYHELKFTYFDYKNIEISGIIDLVIETTNKLVVIDYKLSNIDDPNYDIQVNCYMDYLKTITDKCVEGYLYSINKKQFRKV